MEEEYPQEETIVHADNPPEELAENEPYYSQEWTYTEMLAGNKTLQYVRRLKRSKL